MALLWETFSGKGSSVAHSSYYIYSIYNSVGQSIASIYDLGGIYIFTLALSTLLNMSPHLIYQL